MKINIELDSDNYQDLDDAAVFLKAHQMASLLNSLVGCGGMYPDINLRNKLKYDDLHPEVHKVLDELRENLLILIRDENIPLD